MPNLRPATLKLKFQTLMEHNATSMSFILCMFSFQKTPYVRLDLYGLIEQKIKGDGNCQVSYLQCFMMALFNIKWLRVQH
jgi:hypothetical protein